MNVYNVRTEDSLAMHEIVPLPASLELLLSQLDILNFSDLYLTGNLYGTEMQTGNEISLHPK
jgi:hypothetical protein